MADAIAGLKNQDSARRQAMVDGDVDALRQLLDEDLSWTHSSGTTEDRDMFIAAIESANVSYERLNVEEDAVRQVGEVYLHTGRLVGAASRAGQEKLLRARFLSVWRMTAAGLKLVAWQSTNTND